MSLVPFCQVILVDKISQVLLITLLLMFQVTMAGLMSPKVNLFKNEVTDMLKNRSHWMYTERNERVCCVLKCRMISIPSNYFTLHYTLFNYSLYLSLFKHSLIMIWIPSISSSSTKCRLDWSIFSLLRTFCILITIGCWLSGQSLFRPFVRSCLLFSESLQCYTILRRIQKWHSPGNHVSWSTIWRYAQATWVFSSKTCVVELYKSTLIAILWFQLFFFLLFL